MRRRTVKRYGACPDCRQWSIRIEENGKVARHSENFGFVENKKVLARRGFRATPVCSGSGKEQQVNLHHQLVGFFTFLALLDLREPPPNPDLCPACGVMWPGDAEVCPGCQLWPCSHCEERGICDADCPLAPWNTEKDPAILKSMKEAEDADHGTRG